jgi:3-oxoacyl-[acyl-carrier protein] reductase
MNKVIIITGTSRGIGKELSLHYLNNGDYVIGCSRGEGSISEKNYTHYFLDVADEKAVVMMVKEVNKRFGRIDALLNNAGIASMNHMILTPYKTAKSLFDTNFFGAFLFLREAAKIMIKQKSGRVVNFTTVAVPLGLEGEAIYASGKAALEKFTQVAAKELGGFGITVNAVGPTPVETDLIKNVPENKIKSLLNRQAIKRFGEIKDIVNVIDFFLNEKSSFVSGQIVYLGGVNG